MKDCFRDIHAFGVGFKRAKGYSRAEFNAPEASTFNDVKLKKDPGLCFRCDGSHFQNAYKNTQINLTNDPKACCLQDKITKELLTHENSLTIEVIITHSLQKPCHSKLHNKLNPAMTYHLVSKP